MKTETPSDMKYIIGTVSFVFAALVLQIAMTDAKLVNMPDLIVRNITFLEYNMTLNNTNVTFVNVTTVVKNQGNEPARNSTTRLNRLNVTIDRFTPELLANQAYDFLDTYQCAVGHNYNATADVFNVVNESHEDNNKKTVFIDCVA
ncbi:MAG: CARDB domain-containing protein [Nanoarchaeota archaeon]